MSRSINVTQDDDNFTISTDIRGMEYTVQIITVDKNFEQPSAPNILDGNDNFHHSNIDINIYVEEKGPLSYENEIDTITYNVSNLSADKLLEAYQERT